MTLNATDWSHEGPGNLKGYPAIFADTTGWVNREPRIRIATMVEGLMSSGQFVAIGDRSAFESTTMPSVLRRLVSRRGIALLARNTVVSILTFVVGLTLMWMLVDLVGANKVFSAGASFLAATSLHYAFGRGWVFKGTERDVATGYGYFLINAAIGMTLTVSIFAALISWTSMNYLIARIIVSVFAGLAMFILNATLNFKQL
jgi:putative flippase GtrA